MKKDDYLKVETGLYQHKKDYREFIFDFRIEGKRYRKKVTLKATNWTKKQYIKEASIALQKFKDDLEDGYNVTDKIKLDTLFDTYNDTLPATKWTLKKKQTYNTYIKPQIGSKKIDTIKELHIKKIIVDMEKRGLAPRTQKGILEILKPMFDFAVKNKILKENPISDLTVKIPPQKKIVTNASELFKKVYEAITTVYKDEPFYQALFLFGFSGRRKSEILSLKWENIDFQNNYYWIEDTKNRENQKFILPPLIKKLLLDIQDDRRGLVFKSPVTGKVIVNIDRQMKKLKEFTEIENLSLHYMRNILVSALAEQGVEAIYLSGVLGHKDITTINKYLSQNYFKSSKVALNTIEKTLLPLNIN